MSAIDVSNQLQDSEHQSALTTIGQNQIQETALHPGNLRVPTPNSQGDSARYSLVYFTPSSSDVAVRVQPPLSESVLWPPACGAIRPRPVDDPAAQELASLNGRHPSDTFPG